MAIYSNHFTYSTKQRTHSSVLSGPFRRNVSYKVDIAKAFDNDIVNVTFHLKYFGQFCANSDGKETEQSIFCLSTLQCLVVVAAERYQGLDHES